MFVIDTLLNNDVMLKEFLKHGGVCHQNIKYSPAVYKEHCPTEVGKRLLLNEYDQYVGDDIAIFVDILVVDNNTRSPNKFIQVQHQIIGIIADNKVEHFPDLGHTIQNCSNNFYALKIKAMNFVVKIFLIQ